MKKLLFALIFFIAVSLSAQEFFVLNADSLSNDIEKYGILDLDQFAPNKIENIYITLYSSGEIDIDSVGVYGGVKINYAYQGDLIQTIAWESTALAVEGTVSTNLADGVAGIDQGVPVLTTALLVGYNAIKVVVIGAAAGCDATDTGQKVVICASVLISQRE